MPPNRIESRFSRIASTFRALPPPTLTSILGFGGDHAREVFRRPCNQQFSINLPIDVPRQGIHKTYSDGNLVGCEAVSEKHRDLVVLDRFVISTDDDVGSWHLAIDPGRNTYDTCLHDARM